ncbi:VOC family protein [Planctomycetota bacterium]|nr:VOC family protein [Planctomycetota bacterium]
MSIRFSHVTLITNDWRRLSQFYINALDCEAFYPEINHSGSWVDKSTGVKSARIRGVNLRLPGFESGKDGGPFLEILQYTPTKKGGKDCINCAGSGQVAFEVDDVKQTAERVIKSGAKPIGEYENVFIPGIGTVRFQFFRDPDDNILQLLKWDRLK